LIPSTLEEVAVLTSRRDFLKTAFTGAALPILLPHTLDAVERSLEPFAGLKAGAAASTEEFWTEIRKAFHVSPDFVNLENGYSSPQPLVTLDALQMQVRRVNEALSFYMRRQRADEHIAVKRQLADLAGCPVEEIVITRNTTESMDTVIHGLDLYPGDEAVMTNQDYGSMLEAFRQESKRRQIKCVEIDIPLDPRSDEEVVGAYERAITPKTKLILLTHMINVTGQILPARKICDMAHSHGVEVIIDAAHSFAHVVYDIPSLGGDYFGASLHKWLCTPLGAGILQINRAKIKKVWPLFGETSFPNDDIRKFERVGTQPVWTVAAIPEAIRFHTMIGGERKEERLRYLQQYWTDQVRDISNVYLNTPPGRRACGIANFGIRGRIPGEIADILFNRYGIFTVAIDMEAVKGVRVTPHLYTSLEELDRLVSAIRTIAA
jgi:selenocysteine lyase/cysteine desulfurase